jgi:hypothetical protein
VGIQVTHGRLTAGKAGQRPQAMALRAAPRVMAVGLTPLLAITRRAAAVVAGIPAAAAEADTQAVAVVTVAVVAGTTNFAATL